ncbi:MAG TPA: SsrA-binding protein SmpB [Miltoncostaeaceae bacterium]|nr:SsrA-binding protein SmpB [Miltoncostaeaceae bacterium]
MAKSTKKKTDRDERFRDIARNRRATHEYEILERYEAGLALEGTEVKGLRERGATIRDAYVQIRDGEAWLVGAHIADYINSGQAGHDVMRTRKLLLHRREIEKLARAVAEKGLTIVPLRMYFSKGLAKLEIGVGRGKSTYDKRRAIAERDAQRDAERAMRAARR